MKFETKEEVPDDWGPPDPLLPNWVTNRYVPWTSWRAGAQQWGLSSIRQGESSGTITHEMVHTFGLPDTNPLCAGTGWQYYTLETVQRIGEDSMTPDSGVLIQKSKNNSSNGCGYGCFSWTIDAHPEDMNKVDFLRPRTKTPVMRTVGDYRQLNDALFHAGTDSGSQYEFEDTANRLHFYVLNVQRDATGVQSYDVAIRNLDGAGPHTRGVTVGAPTALLNPAGVSTCTFTVNNTGATLPVTAPASPLDDPNPYVSSDVYRLSATATNGVQVHLTNALAAIKAGQSAQIPVYFQGGNGSVTLRATSESDPTKSAVGVCGQGDVGGAVPATLALTLGTPAAFGAFTPGITKDYTASTTANVISTAGDAALSVADPSTVATGRLVSGAFALPQPLQVKARTAANPGAALTGVGSSAAPTTVLTWSAPASNDAVTVDFAQRVNAVDALRTGTYAKTLTFTLSTTTP